MIRSNWLLAAMLAATGFGGYPVAMPSAAKAAIQSQPSMPAVRKNARLGGFGFARPHWRYTKGVPMSAAQQKRASVKRRNVRRHKRNCGARS